MIAREWGQWPKDFDDYKPFNTNVTAEVTTPTPAGNQRKVQAFQATSRPIF